MDRQCSFCQTVISYASDFSLTIGACPNCERLMLFPAAPDPQSPVQNSTKPRPVFLNGEAPQRKQLVQALLLLAIGVSLAWVLSAFYVTGLMRMLGVVHPLSTVPTLYPYFGLISVIFTTGIVWMSIPNKGWLGRVSFYLISGIAPGAAVGHGIRLLVRYRTTARLYHQHIGSHS
jgi:hypothetical protein